MIQTLTMTRPDDWHLHLRDGEALQAVAKESWTVPEAVPFGVDTLVPLRAGERVAWRLEETRH